MEDKFKQYLDNAVTMKGLHEILLTLSELCSARAAACIKSGDADVAKQWLTDAIRLDEHAGKVEPKR